MERPSCENAYKIRDFGLLLVPNIFNTLVI